VNIEASFMRVGFRKGFCVLFIFISYVVAINPAISQQSPNWKPEKTVEFIVGTSAGGAQDRGARVIQKIIQDKKMIPVNSVVINKAGGGGTVGWTYQGQRVGDAHYLSISSGPLLSNQITGSTKLSYTEFTQISLMFDEHIVFVVKPDSTLTSAKDVVSVLKRDPTALSIGVATAIGGSNHIALGLALKAAGVDIKKLKVVIFNSAGDSVAAAIGGHVDLTVASAANVGALVKAGTLRGLAVPAQARLGGDLAGVPTWREHGVDAIYTSWRGVMAPKGISAAQVAYWDEVMANVARSDEWKNEANKNLWGLHYLNSVETKAFMESENNILRSLLQELGLAK